MKDVKPVILPICAAMLAGTPAWAASKQTSFTVSAQVVSRCTVGDADGQVKVRCTRGTPFRLTLGVGPEIGHDEREPFVVVPARVEGNIVTTTITY